ncbi:HpcH/HpaI aldolase/citrate lyase family protein [Microbulbifer agarilyticus]|uniref:HpcH/HpaI aldolase/citrate lyase family protein n=1 Tax=Microbulbifer agarilyticus TaxID=260552 RepID=UPI001CD4A4B6|nr:CoA ester lyase [Microbulbifer agarilyticus]MCA0900877.1 CoA ester lyase [Microbulbifer agarilyticus]
MFDVRSLLFVPGNRPERFEKALASSADVVCIDLEDAVPVANKADARAAVCTFLASCDAALLARLCVRINAVGTEAGKDDLAALSQSRLPARLMLAKTETQHDISQANSLLGGDARWIALIESASGLLSLDAICQESKLDAVMFGGADFAAQIGAEFSWEPLLWARSQIVVTAASHGLPTIDVPFLSVQDSAGLEQETRRVSALGFSGKAAIHPAQIDPIHRAFAPSEEALATARKMLDAFEQANGGAVVVDGRMVDQPIVDSARRLIARSDADKELV